MSLVSSSHVDLPRLKRTNKSRFAFAEIMAGIVIASVVIGLGALAALSPGAIPY